MGKSFACCNNCSQKTKEQDKNIVNLQRDFNHQEQPYDHDDRGDIATPISYNQDTLYNPSAEDNSGVLSPPDDTQPIKAYT